MSALRARALGARRSQSGTALLLLLVGLAFAGSLPASGAMRPFQGPPDGAPWCRGKGPLRAADLPPRARPSECALEGRVIEDHGVQVTVPGRGQAVRGEAMLTDGSTQLLDVRTEPDGTVTLADVGDESAGAGSTTGSASPGGGADCRDGAYTLSNYRDTTQYVWHFKAGTTPPGLSIGAVAQDLVNGFNAVTGSHNDCGLADEVSATQRYGGNTTAPSGINFQGACPARGDGRYVVDFGNLPASMLARTCWRGTRSPQGWFEVSEVDVKIRSSAALFAGAVPAGCRGARFSIAAIVAHEAGHAFGLNHVDENQHGDLTMSQVTPACSLSPYSLGLGDVRALRALY